MIRAGEGRVLKWQTHFKLLVKLFSFSMFFSGRGKFRIEFSNCSHKVKAPPTRYALKNNSI